MSTFHLTSPPACRLSGRRWPGAVVFGAWFAVTSLLGAWSVAQHALPLPAARPAPQATSAQPLAWHVLGSDCGCSASVADELERQGPTAGWRERVWLVGDEPAIARRLQAAGFTVGRIDAEQLAREHGIQGAPWLALFGSDGRLAYSGGYSTGRPGIGGVRNDYPRLMAGVAAGREVSSLPAYGCATSDGLRRRLDPAGLRFAPRP